jgi:adenylate cyclase
VSGFFAELKRRNVIRLAGLYLVGAWLIVQVAGTVLPSFDVPSWVLRTLIILLALGFVPALVLSWVFELTPEGLKRDEDVAPEQSIAPQTARRMDRTIMAVLALALAYFGFDKFVLAPRREAARDGLPAESMGRQASLPPGPAIDSKSIAVLAFANLSDDKSNEYFTDGVSEELLNVLSKIPGLKVSARTSAFHFKGKDTPIPEIAKELGVAYVVEGSVRKAGDRVRITAQLIKAAGGFHVWSDNFDRELKDIFVVQDEIAGLIAKNLSLKLAAASPSVAAEVNPEAYQLYLEGRQQWSMRTDEAMKRAEKLFRQALELEPNFARAYVGLADTVAVTGALKEEDADNNVRLETLKLVDRALQIDPNLAEAHASRGNILERFGRKDESRAAFERSLALNPNYATAHQWYGRLLWSRGDLDRADAELRRAEELDPIAPIMPGNYGMLLNTMRRYREALAAGDRAVAIQPEFPQGKLVRANALLGLGRKEEAAAIYREFISNPEVGGILRRPWFLAGQLALAGDPSAAQAKLAQLPSEPKIEPFQLAYLLMALGRPEEALAELAKPREKARDPFYFLQPNWDSVRDDPRFLAEIARDGLADGYRAAWRQIAESRVREAAGK